MKLEERSVTLRDGTRALLRSPEICDAERLNAYLRQTSGETHFMVRYPEECNQTLETAQKRLQAMLEDERSFMLAAFIDGELVGNCGVNEIADRLKMRHRASLGISIKKKAWGLGLGTILISRALEQAKENGFTQVELGDFVEIKNSNVSDGTKISHLTYVGDSDVGKNVNFGCGTVTVNYDRAKKYRTVIEDSAFIGCNTNLIAPVRVGEGAYIAAGSTITDDIPAMALSIARARQQNKRDWASKHKLKEK